MHELELKPGSPPCDSKRAWGGSLTSKTSPIRRRQSVITHRLEFLHAPSVDGLAHINVALGIKRHGVRMHEFAYLMPRTAETAEHLSCGAVHHINLLVDFINDEHIFLARVAGKFHRGARTHQHGFFSRAVGLCGSRRPHFKIE